MPFTALNTTYERRKVKSLSREFDRCVELLDIKLFTRIPNILAIIVLLETSTRSLHDQILWQLFHKLLLRGCVVFFAAWADVIIHQLAAPRIVQYLAKSSGSTCGQNHPDRKAVRYVLTWNVPSQVTLATHQLPSRQLLTPCGFAAMVTHLCTLLHVEEVLNKARLLGVCFADTLYHLLLV